MTDDFGLPMHQSIVPPPNNVPYIMAVVLMAALGILGVVAVAVARPGQDNTAIFTAIAGFVCPTTLSLLAFMKAQETHLSVNSRLDAFMRNAELAAHIKGIVAGRAQGRDAANERTDALAAGVNPSTLQPNAHPVQVEVINAPLDVKVNP
jgi:hypothetical protein